MNYTEEVEKWGVFEAVCKGKETGNPFTDYTIKGFFDGSKEHAEVDGFYDGDGAYRVRFMPSREGSYTFRISGSFSDEEYCGRFTVTPPSQNNHGPVRVADTFHFVYEDGTPYYPMGTTCYVWDLQEDSRVEETLKSLEKTCFNKLRFCVWPKHYDYNLGEPYSYPYEGTPMDSSVLTEDNFRDYTGKKEGNCWDFTRFNPMHFQRVEACILALMKRGIEADLIVMHPYDRWGFSSMTREQDELYWNYVIARFSAYRNIWWSLANEYDLLTEKSYEDWERYGQIICEKDHYSHLRSIHNFRPFYDYTRPWITHCSIQRQDLHKTSEMCAEWRMRFGKPVVVDEMSYEGNLCGSWGNITAKEMVRRMWEAVLHGGYPGHGETLLTKDKVLWWSHGGKLRGESWKKAAFLYKILCETPGIGLRFAGSARDETCAVPQNRSLAERAGYRLYYYGFMQPAFEVFHFDESTMYQVEVIDTWNMTIEQRGKMRGKFKVSLPERPYMAIRIYKASWMLQ